MEISSPESQRFRLLELAKQAFELGARTPVVQTITGLSRAELVRVFHSLPQMHSNPGRTPNSRDWIFRANLIVAVHIARFYAVFNYLQKSGIAPAEALVAAYRRYLQHMGHDVRLTFDRAFTLVTLVTGLWTDEEPALEPVICGVCESLYIGTIGQQPDSHKCPLCQVTKAFDRNARIRAPLTHPMIREVLEAAERVQTR